MAQGFVVPQDILPSGASTYDQQIVSNDWLSGIMSGVEGLLLETQQTISNIWLSGILSGIEGLLLDQDLLPEGASTSGLQITGNTSLSGILSGIEGLLLSQDNLPIGAATAALQTTGNTSLSGILSGIESLILGVNTELPTATALADNESISGVMPRIGTVMMGINPNTLSGIDRGYLPKLYDLDYNGTTELVLGVNLRSSGAGEAAEIGINTNPLFVRQINTGGYTDNTTTSDIAPVAAFGFVYDGEVNYWQRQRATWASTSNAGYTKTGIPLTSIVGQLDDSNPDGVIEGSFHIPRITPKRALHVHLRDQNGYDLAVSGQAIKGADSPSIDAFGRWRTSNPYTIFDSKQLFNSGTLVWDDQQVAGTWSQSTFDANRASTTLMVSGDVAGYRVRQTKMRFNYQPGKSQLIFITAVLDASGGGTGITRRMGYFDDKNGIFLEDSAGTYRIVRRTYVTGTAADTAVAKSSWNLDPLDGSGPSGITLDFSKTQILVIDFEWLGVGRVRVGFVINGKIIYAHEFLNTNSLDAVYMSTPNLPIRYSISGTGGGAAGTNTLEAICSTVISEGGIEKNGIIRSRDTDGLISSLTSGAAGLYAVLGLKLQSGCLGAAIDLVKANMTVAAGGGFTTRMAAWRLILNPVVAGTFNYTNETNSCIMYAIGGGVGNTVTGGTVLDGGIVDTLGGTNTEIANSLRLGGTIAGVPDELVLCVKPLTGQIDVAASLSWRELT